MENIISRYLGLKKELGNNINLVVVSKTKPLSKISVLYKQGCRIFGENRVNELLEKQRELPKDIRWHFIGNLQTKKVRLIAPFVSLIHSVDKLSLLKEIEKQAQKNKRTIDCLVQVKIAQEESKQGIELDEAISLIKYPAQGVNIVGLMGMATYTEDESQIRKEFLSLATLFNKLSTQHSSIKYLSMGMSNDYKLAIACSSNLVRIGSKLFG